MGIASRRAAFLLMLLICLVIIEISHGAILRVGNPLHWVQSKPFLNFVRLSGVDQFIQHYQRCKGVELPLFVWGDEIEYGVFRPNKIGHFDLALNATDIRNYLIQQEKRHSDLPIGCEWQPEYGSWMVEAVPRSPYGSYVSDLLNVEKSMQLRRKRLHFALNAGEIAPTTSNFPMLGVEGYEHTEDRYGAVAMSKYVSDRVINPHPRFAALTRNIRLRKGGNVEIVVPDAVDPSKHIEMDAMAFGMGCCCLQVTMQLRNEEESRYLNDQLLVLGPLLQALSASTPIFKGRLAGTDTRWDVISQAVDDRTDAERGRLPRNLIDSDGDLVGGGVKPLGRSRYSSSCLYFAQPRSPSDLQHLQALNDISVDVDEEVLRRAEEQGLDEPLARHIAHMFTRDPLVIFDDAIALDNATTLDHFENIQSTNWRSMRWKPPSLRLGLAYAQRSHPSEEALDASKDSTQVDVDDEGAMNCDYDFDYDFDHNILVEDRDGFFTAPPVISSASDLPLSSFVSMVSPTAEAIDHGDVTATVLVAPTERVESQSELQSATSSTPPLSVSPSYNPDALQKSISTFSADEELQSLGPGWRVEFRPLEVQLTDFENAAFAVFSVLLARSTLAQGHCFYLPMSLVEENMRRAQQKDAAINQKFYVNRRALQNTVMDCNCDSTSASKKAVVSLEIPSLEALDIAELTLDEIFNGYSDDNGSFPGLLPTVQRYMQSVGCDDSFAVSTALRPYLHLLRDRAAGTLPTTARYLRNFIEQHANYRGDGDVSPGIADDLLRHCEDIGMGRVSCPELYGSKWVPQNLDMLDEEDLMFANFTCYVRPQPQPHQFSRGQSHWTAASASDTQQEPLQQQLRQVSTEYLSEDNCSTALLQEEQMTVQVQREVKVDELSSDELQSLVERPKGERSLVGKVTDLLLRPWRKVRRSKEEKIRF